MESPITIPAPSGSDATQHMRLIEALAECAAEKGLAQVTVYDIATRAGSSKRTFYRCFADKEQCFDAAVELFASEAEAAIAALEPGDDVPDTVRRALAALINLIGARTSLARLAFVEDTGAGAGERSLELIFELADKIGASPDAVARRAAIGGAHGLIVDQLIAGRAKQLRRRLPELVYITLLPYLSQSEALSQSQSAET